MFLKLTTLRKLSNLKVTPLIMTDENHNHLQSSMLTNWGQSKGCISPRLGWALRTVGEAQELSAIRRSHPDCLILREKAQFLPTQRLSLIYAYITLSSHLVQSSDMTMLYSVDTSPCRPFYPLLEEPPSSLVQDLPPAIHADCLILDCGDLRNILYSTLFFMMRITAIGQTPVHLFIK